MPYVLWYVREICLNICMRSIVRERLFYSFHLYISHSCHSMRVLLVKLDYKCIKQNFAFSCLKTLLFQIVINDSLLLVPYYANVCRIDV